MLYIRCSKKEQQQILDLFKYEVPCNRCFIKDSCNKHGLCETQLKKYIIFDTRDVAQTMSKDFLKLVRAWSSIRKSADIKIYNKQYLKRVLGEQMVSYGFGFSAEHLDMCADLIEKTSYDDAMSFVKECKKVVGI